MKNRLFSRGLIDCNRFRKNRENSRECGSLTGTKHAHAIAFHGPSIRDILETLEADF